MAENMGLVEAWTAHVSWAGGWAGGRGGRQPRAHLRRTICAPTDVERTISDDFDQQLPHNDVGAAWLCIDRAKKSDGQK